MLNVYDRETSPVTTSGKSSPPVPIDGKNIRVISPDSVCSEVSESESDQELTLSSSPVIKSNIRVIPGRNLSIKKYVKIDEIDVQVDAPDTMSILKPNIFDLSKLPIQVFDIKSDLSISDFTKIKHLCNGSHSHVFKVQYDERMIVLKVLTEVSVANETARREFDREILILSRMNHPNILSLYGSGSLPSKTKPHLFRHLIALEALDGDTLSYHLALKRNFHTRPFTELRYLRMAKEFISAIQYLHDEMHPECLVIHRDLKPDNLAFTSEGALKLMDFGLCVCLKKNTHENATYQLTGCTGSLRYMAPEVALNKPYNEKVDIYGFGLILYEMITGVTPFSGYSKDKLYKDVIHGNERPGLDYDDYGREVRAKDAVKSLITRCWDPCPEGRPAASEALAVLDQTLSFTNSRESRKSFLSRSIGNLFSKKDSI